MFKRSFISFLLVISGAICLILFLTLQMDRSQDPAALLPADTVAVVDVKNPVASYRAFKQSPLGRQLGSMAWDDALSELGVPPGTRDWLLGRWTAADYLLTQPAARELIARRAVMAVIPGDEGLDQWPGADPETVTVFIARPRRNASVLNLVAGLFPGGRLTSEQSYRGRMIRHYQLADGRTVSTAVTGGLVVASYSASPVKQCIDLSLKNMTEGISGLKADPRYRSLRRHGRGDEDQFYYVNVAALHDLFKGRLPARDRELTIPRSGSFALFRRITGGKLRLTVVARETGSAVPLAGAAPPVKNKFLPRVPADVLAYAWTNSIDLSRLLAAGKRSGSGSVQAMLGDLEGWLAVNSSLNLEEFASLFGNQFGLYVNAIRATGFLPMPRVGFRIQIRDRPAFEQLLAKAFSDLDTQRTRLGDTEIHVVILGGGLIEPAFALDDGYLFFADSRQQLEQIIGGKKERLVDDPGYRKADIGLAGPSNVIAYFRNHQLVDGFKEFALLAGTLLSVGNSAQAASMRRLAENVLLPLLDGFAMFHAQSVRVYAAENQLVIDTALLKTDDKQGGR